MALLSAMDLHRVDILKQVATVGRAMGVSFTYQVERTDVPCLVAPVSSKEMVRFNQKGEETYYVLYFREDPQVTRQHAFRFNGRFLEYQSQRNPLELGRFWKVYVKECNPPGVKLPV